MCVYVETEREREREGMEGGREGGRDLALNSNKNSPGNDLLIQVNATHLAIKVCSVACWKAVVREGSVQSNRPELMWQNATHLPLEEGAFTAWSCEELVIG